MNLWNSGLRRRFVRHEAGQAPDIACRMACQMKPRMRHLLLALLASLVALLATVGCPSIPSGGQSIAANTPVVPRGLSGRLLYTRDGGLWTLALDTGRAAQIVAGPEVELVTAARWSPDATRVAYALAEVRQVRDSRIPVFEIRVSSADGSGMQKLPDPDEIDTATGAPKWAPDGAHLYLTKTGLIQGQRIRRIERADLASGARTTVIEEVGAFDVSAEGRQLALAPGSREGVIVLVDLGSGAQRTILEGGRFENIAALRFDPGARTILFTAAESATRGTLSGAPGGNRIELPQPGAQRVHAHGPPQDVYAVSLDGRAVRRVVEVGADEPAIAPSPDGNHLAILSADSLAVVPTAGGKAARLLTPGGAGTVDWAL